MNHIDRRTVLRGLGAAISLPMLEGMMPLTALAQSAPKAPVRMAFVFVPNGVDIHNWTPTTAGRDFVLPEVLAPLNPVKDSLNVLTGLTQQNAEALGDGPGDHARSTAAWLTGVHPRKTAGADIEVGISADQVAAMHLGNKTKFASLELGCERGAQAGNCDSGYSCAYSSSISWRGPSTPNAKEVNPRLAFERLFGTRIEDPEAYARRLKYRLSILDFVGEEATQLKGQVGLRDRQKLDEYLTGIREIETRIEKYEAQNRQLVAAGFKQPTGIPQEFGEHIRLMSDMLILAFQTDQTRIATFMYANDGSNRPYNNLGVSEGHHDMSHHGNDPYKLERKRRIDRFHVEQFAYLLTKMATIKEGDGTMLDNSMIVYGAGISDGDRHNHDNLPILLAGKAGKTLKTGQHMVYQNRTPMNNLFLSMLDRAGVPIEKLGDSTGKLQPLF